MELGTHRLGEETIAYYASNFAPILQICADFAPIFEPKSWSQTNKLDLVFLKLKNRKPLYLLGISDFSWLGARTDSNRRHSEPQSDALTN